ncbi:hypothetical protein AB0L74_04350 [Streptomyces sp. NPDC052020]|uniref:hypothetical protein n=1 Tax=Streptomyces sp. NPDC052020 TaxID=3155677 RepID=UPI003427DF23
MAVGYMRYGTFQNAGGDETFLEADRAGGKAFVAANRHNQFTPPTGGGVSVGVGGVGQVGTAGWSYGWGVMGSSIADGGLQAGVVGLGNGSANTGVVGEAHTGSAAWGVWGKSNQGYAGWFSGKVHITGGLTKASGGFKIDHPLDPENKYLVHSFVESPDMLNVYSGNVETDGSGEAVVVLPGYFEALNQDFTYQLTCVGQFAQAIIAEEIQDNRFSIKTDKPSVKVSWQVTGVRQDPYAVRNRISPEEEKSEGERGLYLHPEAYDQPRSSDINYERERAHEIIKSDLQKRAAELFEEHDAKK